MRQLYDAIMLTATVLVLALFCFNVYETISAPYLIASDVVEFLVLIFLFSRTSIAHRLLSNRLTMRSAQSAGDRSSHGRLLRGIVISGFLLVAASVATSWFGDTLLPIAQSPFVKKVAEFAFAVGIVFVFVEPLYALYRIVRSRLT